jgi:hypothetical protein
MSWLYSRGLVAEYLAGNCLDGEQSAPLSLTPMPQAYCAPDKMTDFSRLSRFGMTFAPLTENHGGELLMWFLAGFHARTLAQQEKAQGSPERKADYGKSLRGSFAKYDQVSVSWKTRQYSLLGGLIPYSGTWPRWGMMRNGECWALPILERHTKETEYGLWPTLQVHDRHKGNAARVGRYGTKHGGRNLNDEVAMWPTPTASNTKAVHMRGADKGKKRKSRTYLPTPNATDYKGPSTRSAGKERPMCDDDLPTRVGGQLNPTWVEWLMGWPQGWTDLRPLETGKFHNARQKHGDC